jgi:hypothetical protein
MDLNDKCTQVKIKNIIQGSTIFVYPYIEYLSEILTNLQPMHYHLGHSVPCKIRNYHKIGNCTVAVDSELRQLPEFEFYEISHPKGFRNCLKYEGATLFIK